MFNTLKVLLLACFLTLYSTLTLAAPRIINDVDFSNYRGKWVVVAYWATWCGYCMEEIPALNAFYRAHANQVAMFGVNYDDPGNLYQHIRQSGVIFPTLAHDPKLGRISGLPTTFLIDPNGRVSVLESPQTKTSLERTMGLRDF